MYYHSGFKDDAFAQLVELGTLGQGDGNLRVYSLGVFLINAFLLDLLDDGVSILRKDLREFEDERDALSHTFNLDTSVLFHDQLCQE